MKPSVRISRQAENDICRNALWWAEHHSIDEAIHWESVIRRQLLEIAEAPESYGLSGENSFLPFEVHDSLIGTGQRGSYRAIFTFNHEIIVVLRVLRASQGSLEPGDIWHL